jgi:hypothetical protein
MRRLVLLLALTTASALGCHSTDSPESASGGIGEPCASVAQCRDGLTCATSIDFPEATCELGCDPQSPSSCPEGYACTAMQSGRYCLQQCLTPLLCKEDELCLGSYGSLDRTCMPKSAQAGSCGYLPRLVAGGQVGPATEPASCQKPVASSVIAPEQVQRLGTHAVNDAVTFEVPPGTYGLSVVEQAVSASDSLTYQGFTLDNAAVPLTLTGPSGQVLYDDFDAGGPPAQQYVYVGAPASVQNVVGLPNTSVALDDIAAHDGLPAGTWTAVVNDYANECPRVNAEDPTAACDGGGSVGQYDVTVLTRPKPESGRVDLAFYLVSEGLPTSEQAVNDPAVVRMVRTVAEIYGRRGLCPDTVTFYDLPDWARAKYAAGIDADEVSPCSNLFQLFTLSQPTNTLNFFLVQSISSSLSGGYSIVGLDGTIPGPSSFGGSVHSGAAVSSADLEGDALSLCGPKRNYLGCGPDFVGYITAHEGGHWLGLFHTTESDGELFDPLNDTATCACEACAPASQQGACGALADGGFTMVTGSDCASGGATCGGADNLMFWLIDGQAAGHLSDEQVQVMKSNVVVH